MSIVTLSRGIKRSECELTSLFHLVPKLRMRGTKLPLLHTFSLHGPCGRILWLWHVYFHGKSYFLLLQSHECELLKNVRKDLYP
jgi:hypothetical protein